MTSGIAVLVLFAAFLHASWNAVLKGGGDGLWTMTVMGIATSLACAALLPFLPLPTSAPPREEPASNPSAAKLHFQRSGEK